MANRHFLKPKGVATVAEILQWQRDQTDYSRLYERWALVRQWELNRQYTIENHQWLQDATSFVQTAGAAGSYSVNPFFEPLQTTEAYEATPVQNELISIMQNEVARWIAGKTDFTILRTDRSTRIDRAAQKGERWLRANNLAVNWRGLEHIICRDGVLFGTGIARTAQEMDFVRTTSVPADALACTSCRWVARTDRLEAGAAPGQLLISGAPAVAIAQRFMGQALNFDIADDPEASALPYRLHADSSAPDPRAVLDRCPECGSALAQRKADPADVAYDKAPLTDELPTYDPGVGAVSPYDFFPIANGRLDPDRGLRQWTRESIVTLDWVSRHYRNGSKVRPSADDDLPRLAMWHPASNEDGSLWATRGGASTNMLDGFTVLRETVREPYWDYEDPANQTADRKPFPKGRWIVTAGDQVLIDDDLLIEDPRSGTLVPRVRIHSINWEHRVNSFWGQAQVTYARSLQDNINTINAQAMLARHQLGAPKLLLGPTTSIEYSGQQFGGYQNTVWRYQGEKPEQIPGIGLTGQWQAEMQYATEAIQRITSSRAVEQGNAPGHGVTAFSALQLLKDTSAVTREPRIDQKKVAVREMFTHRLQLAGIIITDNRKFRAVSERGDTLGIEAFTGMDLMGQYDIELHSSPFVEAPLVRREAAREALQAGLLQLRTAADKRRYFEATGVPTDIAISDSIQTRIAQDEWLAYMSLKDTPDGPRREFHPANAPVVKSRLDDHRLHIDEHFEVFYSWEGDEIRRHLNDLERLLAGWRDEYQLVESQRQQLLMSPPPPIPIIPPSPIPGREPTGEQIDIAGAQWGMQQKTAQQLSQLPSLPELRLLAFWVGKLQKQGYQLPTYENGGLYAKSHVEDDAHREQDDFLWSQRILVMDDMACLRWLVHIYSHMDELEMQQAQAVQTGTPQTQAPGGRGATSAATNQANATPVMPQVQ